MAAPTGILAMLAKPKGKGGAEKSGPPELGGEYDGGGEVASALGDMFKALKAGDNEGAALAFKRAKVACDDEGEEDDMSDLDMGMGDEDETSDEE
jgi:hypothetical protein